MYKRFLLFFFLFWVASANRAEESPIVKCTQPDGSVLYSNQGCENGKGEVVVSRPITIVQAPVFLPKENPITLGRGMLLLYVFMSVLCFMLFVWDKRRAIKKERRIPEIWLHTVELLGGWIGSFIAQRTVQHKRRKFSYRMVFWLIVILHQLWWSNYLSGNLLWDLVSGKETVDIKQRVVEKVMEQSGLNPVPSQDMEKQLDEMLRNLQQQQKAVDEEL